MSKRELIAENIMDVLANSEDPRFGLVTREHFEVHKLSRQQFPAIFISTADETRTDESMTGGNSGAGIRSSMLQFQLAGYVNGKNVDTLRNDLIERVEEVLDLDRTRGGNARYTSLTEVTVDYDQPEHFGRVDMLVDVYYTFTRGTS